MFRRALIDSAVPSIHHNDDFLSRQPLNSMAESGAVFERPSMDYRPPASFVSPTSRKASVSSQKFSVVNFTGSRMITLSTGRPGNRVDRMTSASLAHQLRSWKDNNTAQIVFFNAITTGRSPSQSPSSSPLRRSAPMTLRAQLAPKEHRVVTHGVDWESLQSTDSAAQLIEGLSGIYSLGPTVRKASTKPTVLVADGAMAGEMLGVFHRKVTIATERSEVSFNELKDGVLPGFGVGQCLVDDNRQRAAVAAIVDGEDAQASASNTAAAAASESSPSSQRALALARYLVFSGRTLTGADLYSVGLATHIMPSSTVGLLVETVGETVPDDRGARRGRVVDASSLAVLLEHWCEDADMMSGLNARRIARDSLWQTLPDPAQIPTAPRVPGVMQDAAAIEACMQVKTVEDAVRKLATEAGRPGAVSAWASACITNMASVHPLLLKAWWALTKSARTLRPEAYQAKELAANARLASMRACITAAAPSEVVLGLGERGRMTGLFAAYQASAPTPAPAGSTASTLAAALLVGLGKVPDAAVTALFEPLPGQKE